VARFKGHLYGINIVSITPPRRNVKRDIFISGQKRKKLGNIAENMKKQKKQLALPARFCYNVTA
jgi:hypothetical protein